VNLPSVVSDELPALESASTDLVREKLTAIHSARQNFIKAESSEKIKRALKHQVRTYAEEDYVSGDKVHFKRNDTKGWRGPAKVLGKEGNFFLVRQGSFFYRCHPCHLRKIDAVAAVEKGGGSTANSSARPASKKPAGAVVSLPSIMDIDSSEDEHQDV